MERSSDIAALLTAREVAHLLHYHINTIRRLDNCGILRAYHIGPRGDRRFEQKEVLRIAREVSNRNKKDNNK